MLLRLMSVAWACPGSIASIERAFSLVVQVLSANRTQGGSSTFEGQVVLTCDRQQVLDQELAYRADMLLKESGIELCRARLRELRTSVRAVKDLIYRTIDENHAALSAVVEFIGKAMYGETAVRECAGALAGLLMIYPGLMEGGGSRGLSS